MDPLVLVMKTVSPVLLQGENQFCELISTAASVLLFLHTVIFITVSTTTTITTPPTAIITFLTVSI